METSLILHTRFEELLMKTRKRWITVKKLASVYAFLTCKWNVPPGTAITLEEYKDARRHLDEIATQEIKKHHRHGIFSKLLGQTRVWHMWNEYINYGYFKKLPFECRCEQYLFIDSPDREVDDYLRINLSSFKNMLPSNTFSILEELQKE